MFFYLTTHYVLTYVNYRSEKFLSFSQTFVKWSAPDEDNKCLGEVLLTIDPKCRGPSTGNDNIFASLFLLSSYCVLNQDYTLEKVG